MSETDKLSGNLHPAREDGMPAREYVLGVGVSAVNMETAVRTICEWIDGRECHYVCVTGVHGVMESQRSALLRRIHNVAGMVLPDGMPLAWLLRLGGHVGTGRVCGPELMPQLFVESQARGDRHFLYGATAVTLERLRQRLALVAPEARVVGSYAPPFRPLTEEEQAAMVTDINASRADIVWVELSTPKQELWMAANRPLLQAPVLIGVGAAFDIHAGVINRAPKFLRSTGFEWTYRLFKEPGRLWRRYQTNNPRFVALVIMERMRTRRAIT